MTEKKIKLNTARKNRNRIPKEERSDLIKAKGDEISKKSRIPVEDLKKDKAPFKAVIPEVEEVQEESRLIQLVNKLPKKEKFIKNGLRQQSSINTSDYTATLIEILVEAKLEEGDKIKKTSYLEKVLVKGLKKELADLGIKV